MAKEKFKPIYVQFAPQTLAADRFWRSQRCAIKGLYWAIITDLYVEGGTFVFDRDQVKKSTGWTDEDGDFDQALKLVLTKISKRNGKLYHKRVTQEIQQAQEAHRKRSSAGKKGASRRRLSNAQTPPEQCLSNAEAMLKQCLVNEMKGNETKGNEMKGNETNRKGNEKSPSVRWQVEAVKALTEVENILRPVKLADHTTFKNIVRFLAAEILAGHLEPSAWNKLVALARNSKTGKNRFAVFVTKVKEEFNWNPTNNQEN